MSSNFRKSKNFVELIFKNNQRVNKFILFDASNKLLEAIVEIFYVFCLPLAYNTKRKFLENIKVQKKFIHR